MCRVYSQTATATAIARRRRAAMLMPFERGFLLVLFTCRRFALRERPSAIGEFERQQPVVLAGGPQRPVIGIEMHLRATPVGPAGAPLTDAEVIGARARCRGTCRVVVGDFLRLRRS